jgi:phage FluMu protein Com
MPKKWCPKCKREVDEVIRVTAVSARWNHEQDDYVSTCRDDYEAEEYDRCTNCEALLEESEGPFKGNDPLWFDPVPQTTAGGE